MIKITNLKLGLPREMKKRGHKNVFQFGWGNRQYESIDGEIGNCESCDGYVNNYPKIKTETTNLVMLCIPVHAVFQSP